MSKDCLFCRIVRGELEADRVAEGSRWVAIRDVNPQAPIHVLVIPREHVESLNEMDSERAELAGELLLAAREVAEQEGLAEAGYRVVANTNRDGGQTVPHLHLHLLGGRSMRWPPG
ncbi:MAG: histidine triad nucleotide-binding protein [Gemmatimonadota bacterium]